MTTYKEVFQLAQDKGYVPFHCTSCGNILIDRKKDLQCSNCCVDSNVFPTPTTQWNIGFPEELLKLTLIQKWLRDEYKINVFSSPTFDGYHWKCSIQEVRHKGIVKPAILYGSVDTYEQALTEGINEALKLIK